MEQIETALKTEENVLTAFELIFGSSWSAWCCWMGVVLSKISNIYNAYLFVGNKCVKHYVNEKSLLQLYYSDKMNVSCLSMIFMRRNLKMAGQWC